MRYIDTIILHTAACKRQTDAKEIKKWHMQQGWKDIGYHFVITGSPWDKKAEIQFGRPIDITGAHALNSNKGSIGICMTGHGDFEVWTERQLYLLHVLTYNIMKSIPLYDVKIIGHRETPYEIGSKSKTCPGRQIIMDSVRETLRLDAKTMSVPMMYTLFGGTEQQVILKQDTFVLGDKHVIA